MLQRRDKGGSRGRDRSSQKRSRYQLHGYSKHALSAPPVGDLSARSVESYAVALSVRLASTPIVLLHHRRQQVDLPDHHTRVSAVPKDPMAFFESVQLLQSGNI
uniref:Uncharacterized protein n=1 Tax=Chromera velia CCMP2878 TaxID=1169474 RepID=A0A0G4I8W8_9ALVE|eukprot:Cvel_12012.t1-p1 / transcript=Cvel_12012.t1 / gene=Cvel_12012 / organism=Chromera_velia_CCMP2878 / gene_product=hypothetical protein / transcript_product=hypothetical protein / location=Cvel_scaffold771:24151-27778(-) / protein_length=103 / sequence_SO=supercontig / SO=protein_coding / is_pseudo=false